MSMVGMSDFFKKDRFAKLCGFELLQAGQGYARVMLKIRDEHLNSAGSVHGGVIFSLADAAFAVASNSHGPAAAINVSISFLKAAGEGALTAEAKEISLGSKLASYTVNVRDKNDDLTAVFQGMVYRKSEKKE